MHSLYGTGFHLTTALSPPPLNRQLIGGCAPPNATVRDVDRLVEEMQFTGFPITEDGKLGSKLLGLVPGPADGQSSVGVGARVFFVEGGGCARADCVNVNVRPHFK